MPNNNPGNNRLGWSVNAGNGSGRVMGGIFGAALGALGDARRTQQRLHEFDYKENAKRETYMQRKAADAATHSMRVNTNEQSVLKIADIHKDKQNFNYNASNGSINYSQPSDYADKMQKIAETNLAAQKLRNQPRPDAKDAEPATGTKKARSTKKTEAAANAGDAWAAQPVASRTTSNITPPASNAAPRVRKPRAPRAPKNPGQSGGMQ
jgi:hypothetical protein